MAKKKKVEDVFIEVGDEKVPIKLFMIQMKKNYMLAKKVYNDLEFKLSSGKLRPKTREKLVEEFNQVQTEMLEIGAVYWGAYDLAIKEGVEEEIKQDKFLNDEWQLTDEQKAELEKEREEKKESDSRLDKYIEHFKLSAIPSLKAQEKNRIEKEIVDSGKLTIGDIQNNPIIEGEG